jgi:hypothetical protein
MGDDTYPYGKRKGWLEDLGGGGWPHLRRYDLPSAGTTFDVPILATICPDGSEDYRGIHLVAYLEAVTSSISDPKMIVTADTTESNYWGAGGINEPKVKNGSLLTATAMWLTGTIVPYIEDGDMVAYMFQSNVTTSSRAPVAGGSNFNWGWLPGSATSFDTLRFYRDSGGDFNDTCFVQLWGIP